MECMRNLANYLVEEAQRLVEPWLGDLELEGVSPVPFTSVGEGENQCHGCNNTRLHQ